MDNKPKKSKALIITIIILLVLILSGYLIYKNRDAFGVKTSATIAKIFSPLGISENSGKVKTIAQAGEDISKGDNVSVFGTGTDNNPIVLKTGSGDEIFGTANEDIAAGNLGEILSDQKEALNNSFWDSFSNFVGDIFGKDTNNNGNDNGTSGNTDIDPNTTPNLPIYECKKDGVVVDCSTLNPIDLNSYECKKDDIIVDCSTMDIPAIINPIVTDGTPDLIPEAPTPTKAVLNKEITISSVIRNKGDGGTKTGFANYFSISFNNATIVPVRSAPITDAIEAMSSDAAKMKYTFTEKGTYKVRICVDKKNKLDAGLITEGDENNNCAFSNIIVGEDGVDGNGTPDLIPEAPTPTKAVLNKEITISSVIRNKGDGGTKTGFANYFSISFNNATIVPVRSAPITDAIEAMSSDAAKMKYTFTEKGTYKVRICVDKKNKLDAGLITEGDENNNCAEGSIIIGSSTTDKLPSVKVTATPSSISTSGESTISWTSENTTSCNAGDGNSTNTSGSFKVKNLTANKIFTVTCTGEKGSASGNAIVVVNGGEDLTPSVKVTASPSSIKSGATSYISWETKNATYCKVAGDSITYGTQEGFVTETLTSTKSYAVTCTGDNGSASGSTAVIVSNGIDPVDGTPDVTANTVTPAQATLNETTTLSSIISNIGSGSTKESFDVFFSIRTTATDNPVVVKTIQTSVSSLNAKTSGVAKVSYIFNQKGTFSVRACADKNSESDTGKITESNEENNCGGWTIITISEIGPIPNPENPTTTVECNDSADNDGDGKIDEEDPNCHEGDVLTGKYLSTKISESEVSINNPEEINQCTLISDNPLTFTDTEKAKLAELLRKFYIIAPTLKTSEDINLIYKQMEDYKNLISSVDTLTKQCYDQTDKNTAYTGPTERSGNPWYNSNVWKSYIPGDESGSASGGTTKTTNYCTGKITDKYRNAKPSTEGKRSCSTSEKQVSEFACTRYRYQNWFGGWAGYMNTGCTWVGGIDGDETTTTGTNMLREYEKILYIW